MTVEMKVPKRRSTAGVVGAMLIAIFGYQSGAALAKEDRPLVIARFLDINSLDPARSSCETCNLYLGATYETLVKVGPDERSIVSGLAETFEANSDNTVFTFKLNPAAKFADGSPVEAKDLKWTWERVRNGKGGMSFLLDDVKSIETPDERTVIVALTGPNSEFLGKITAPYVSVVNSDLAAANGAKADEAAGTDTAEPWFLANSAGSGPYVLVEYRPNDVLRLKRNESYWGKPPAIGEVIIRNAKDAVAQAQAVESGDADLATQIDPDTAGTIKSPDVVVERAPTFNFLYLALAPGAKANKVPLTREVREAIGYAIDYQGVVDFTVGGAGRLQPVAIPNGFPGTDGLPQPETNLDKAKELLAKAGHPDGFEMDARFANLNAYGVDFSLLAQKLQQDLAKINIKLNLQPITFSTWLEEVNGPEKIPLTISFYGPDYFGTDMYINTFGMYEGTRWANRSGALQMPENLNPREKELLTKALASPAAERDALYNEIATMMIADKIIFPLVNPDIMLVRRKNVAGLRNTICCLVTLSELSFTD